jgi:H+-translocating NAD(P) transhydrogenase subunit alpha
VSGTVIVSIYVLVLAGFLGFELITKVPPTLHTPLMSGANAMSGITVVGALSLAAVSDGFTSTLLAVLALALATVNVVGGFFITDRMLATFGERPRPAERAGAAR